MAGKQEWTRNEEDDAPGGPKPGLWISQSRRSSPTAGGDAGPGKLAREKGLWCRTCLGVSWRPWEECWAEVPCWGRENSPCAYWVLRVPPQMCQGPAPWGEIQKRAMSQWLAEPWGVSLQCHRHKVHLGQQLLLPGFKGPMLARLAQGIATA